MRILLDYRPALRARTGVGEYVHQLTAALARARVDRSAERRAGDRRAYQNADTVEIFTSSWKDRPAPDAIEELGLRVHLVDRRIPVRLLNLAWHRLSWPPVELLTGRTYDVVHSPHPLLFPSRRAARVCTIHDLDFLVHPEWTTAEIRRDYPALVAAHAQRADAILVPSQYVAQLVRSRLGVPAERVTVCYEGVPAWLPRDTPAPPEPGQPDPRYLLFFGTLHPRKNVAGLLDAYARLCTRHPETPRLVLAGGKTATAAPWLEALTRPPLAGRVEYRGYIPNAERQALYEGARLLVLPSFDEGFGLPVAEAMSLGIPVVVSNRGSLPEIAGQAGVVVDPDDPDSIAAGILRLLTEPGLAQALAARGTLRARDFTWDRAARATRAAYEQAIERQRDRRAEAR